MLIKLQIKVDKLHPDMPNWGKALPLPFECLGGMISNLQHRMFGTYKVPCNITWNLDFCLGWGFKSLCAMKMLMETWGQKSPIACCSPTKWWAPFTGFSIWIWWLGWSAPQGTLSYHTVLFLDGYSPHLPNTWQPTSKELAKFWEDEKHTSWYQNHPIFKDIMWGLVVLSLWVLQTKNTSPIWILFLVDTAKKTNHPLTAQEVDPNYVIPLRIFGDGAESHRNSSHIPVSQTPKSSKIQIWNMFFSRDIVYGNRSQIMIQLESKLDHCHARQAEVRTH